MSSIRRFTVISAFAVQDMMEMELTASKSRLTARKKTSATFMLIAFTMPRREEAHACVKKDMKELAEFVSWSLSARRLPTVDITPFAIMECAIAIKVMKETTQTCKFHKN